MIKNTVIALLAVASVSAVAVPAFAAPIASTDAVTFNWPNDAILADLHDKGVNATSVEEWGGLVRAFVKLDNGAEVMQFFTPGTLNPVTL